MSDRDFADIVRRALIMVIRAEDTPLSLRRALPMIVRALEKKYDLGTPTEEVADVVPITQL